ncbi:hypothetical protein GCM10009078_20960 [Cupriavidus gilardii]
MLTVLNMAMDPPGPARFAVACAGLREPAAQRTVGDAAAGNQLALTIRDRDDANSDRAARMAR